MKLIFATLLLVALLCTRARAQDPLTQAGQPSTYALSGEIHDTEDEAVVFANVALYRAADSSLVKVGVSDENGHFNLGELPEERYFMVVSYLGLPELRQPTWLHARDHHMGVLTMAPGGVELGGATVTATRALVEVKDDRTVFNVQGTINAAGNDGLELLRKSPGVDVDFSDNISVLGRTGVLIYVDGRRLPLQGAELATYLRSLTAEQIDRIDIITSPGARYEAQGNAGIIDIRLKKAEDEGANGTLTTSGSQGRYAIYALNAGGNFRNRSMNVYGNVGYTQNTSFTDNDFTSFQNDFFLQDDLYSRPATRTPAIRLGTDLYLGERHTVGLLYTGQYQGGDRFVANSTSIASFDNCNGCIIPPTDSILRARVEEESQHDQHTANLNWNFAIGTGQSLNVDVDYGAYRNRDFIEQPNRYFGPNDELLSVSDDYFETPIDIDILTARADYDFPLFGGGASAGAKVTQVGTDNSFLFSEVGASGRQFIPGRSNDFSYDERVYAAYLTYAGDLSEQLSYTAGLRVESTDAEGFLRPHDPLEESRLVGFDYTNLFPNASLAYTTTAGNRWSLRYGRRINRPDYKVLNPFRVQLNELSYRRGNPFLQPEIVNNVELGYTLKRRYNFKLAYSYTDDKIANLLSPDEQNPRAGFETYANLANQTVWSLTASAPVQITEWWRFYGNFLLSYTDNRADYGDEGTVDVQVFSGRAIVQNAFTLPGGFRGEISGLLIGPGVAGGTFEYDPLGSLNLGLSRNLGPVSAKLTFNDVFYTSIIRGTSDFGGLLTTGRIERDSRRVGLSLSYNFGNQR